MTNAHLNGQSLLARLYERFFPKSADFFRLLTEQSRQVEHTVGLLVQYMQSGDAAIGDRIREDEHAADKVKVGNIHTLNEAFSTPIDREDIYRAITTLDEVVNACKDAVSEMDALQLKPDAFTLDMARLLMKGVEALTAGYGRLSTLPAQAATDADAARKAERKVEKLYRKALAQLFNGDDYIHMFKRREIYRHLTHAAERMAACANTLHDIVVKMV
jgi:predicted phosphate transport protein (TIGR00153 family)